MVIVRMTKVYTNETDDVFKIVLGNIEDPKRKEVVISLSPCEADRLKHLFLHNKKSGKLKENEEWF